MRLLVKVSDDFSLDAGDVIEHSDSLLVLPPQRHLFDQLCEWLDQLPPPAIGFHHWALGIGATALCFRWGTYLAVLMDGSKPVDPRARDPATSLISDQEMQRINVEASSNFARLLRLWHEDEGRCFDRLRRAYEWLPMPQRRVKRNWETLGVILGTLRTAHELDDVDFPESAQLATAYPYRSLANAVVSLAYRNGPVESVHAGARAAYRLVCRRFTDRQMRTVIRSAAERISGVVSAYPLWEENLLDLPPWPERLTGLPFILLYPRRWSLTESSTRITLKKKWTE